MYVNYVLSNTKSLYTESPINHVNCNMSLHPINKKHRYLIINTNYYFMYLFNKLLQ